MPRTVTMQIVGLGAVVKDGDVTKVLLPATHDHAGGSHSARTIPPHTAVLGRVADPATYPDDWIDFAGGVLRVSRSRRARPATIPSELVDLSAFSHEDVPAALRSGPIDRDRLTGRVELEVGDVLDGNACAEYVLITESSAGEGSMATRAIVATQLVASFDLDDDEELTVVREIHENGQKVGDESIEPPVKDGHIVLRFYHVPPEELPPNVPPEAKDGQEIEHVDVYWRLFKNPERPARMWLLDQDPHGPQAAMPPLIGSAKTCPITRAT